MRKTVKGMRRWTKEGRSSGPLKGKSKERRRTKTARQLLKSWARTDNSFAEGIPSRHASRASKLLPQVNPHCRIRALLLSWEKIVAEPFVVFIPHRRRNVKRRGAQPVRDYSLFDMLSRKRRSRGLGSDHISSGAPIAAIRPSFMKAMRVETFRANSSSWVTMNTH